MRIPWSSDGVGDGIMEDLNIFGENGRKDESCGDIVRNPSHYTEGRTYEPRKVAEDWGLVNDAYLFSAFKYISRAGRKLYPGKSASESLVIDCEKAIEYLVWRVEYEKGRRAAVPDTETTISACGGDSQ